MRDIAKGLTCDILFENLCNNGCDNLYAKQQCKYQPSLHFETIACVKVQGAKALELGSPSDIPDENRNGEWALRWNLFTNSYWFQWKAKIVSLPSHVQVASRGKLRATVVNQATWLVLWDNKFIYFCLCALSFQILWLLLVLWILQGWSTHSIGAKEVMWSRRKPQSKLRSLRHQIWWSGESHASCFGILLWLKLSTRRNT